MRAAWVKVSALLGLLAFAGGPAAAQGSFPSRQVHIYIPYPAGGAVDLIGRTLGDELGKAWGQSVVIENRPGAGGTIASRALAGAAPDGHTLIVVASGHATNPLIYPKLPYDTFKDFTSISLIGASPNILLVPASSPFKTLGDLLSEARQKPGALSYGMAGAGTSTHLAGELLKVLAKVDIATVAYRGGAPAINDLIGGHIPISVNNAPESLPQIKAGTVRALGVTTAERSPFLPDVPTIAEAGVPGYDTAVWWAALGPAGMSADVVAALSRDFTAALQAPAVKERLATQGATVIGGSPQQLDALIRAEYEKWAPVIKAAGIKAE
jgi:tripartite-type tricarboxylate transporter receptor subunit TctC